MRRRAFVLLLASSLTGCMSMGPDNGGGGPPGQCQGGAGCSAFNGRVGGPMNMQTVQDPYGRPYPLQGPYAANPPGNAYNERQMIASSIDPSRFDYYDEKKLEMMKEMLAQMPMTGDTKKDGDLVNARRAMSVMPIPQGGVIAPKGKPLMPGMDVLQANYSQPQTQQAWTQPSNWGYGYNYNGYYQNYNPYYGYYPATNGWPANAVRASNGEIIQAEDRSGESSGVRQAQFTQPLIGPGYGSGQPGYGGGTYYGAGGMGGGYPGMSTGANCAPAGNQRTQIKFTEPNGMKVAWYGCGFSGQPMWSPIPLEVPGRYNFVQGATYRLKITNIEFFPLMEFYPTMEVMPATAKTSDFLAHSAVPLGFSRRDLQQVKDGNYLVKVIYLPDPQYQSEVGPGGVEEIVSTLLDPGTDPIKEARKRGSILLVIRIGNVQQELDHSPPLNASSRGQGSAACPPGMGGTQGCPPMSPGMPGCPPSGPGFMPGAQGYMPGGVNCPPAGQCYPPGAQCYPQGGGGAGSGLMPPTWTTGGDPSLPFSNTRSLPQMPYMVWPYGPYANGPYAAQNQNGYQQGYGPGMQQYCPPQYQQQQQQMMPCPPWMLPNANRGSLPPGGNPAARGMQQPNMLPRDMASNDFTPALPPPFPTNDKKSTTSSVSTGDPNRSATSASQTTPLAEKMLPPVLPGTEPSGPTTPPVLEPNRPLLPPPNPETPTASGDNRGPSGLPPLAVPPSETESGTPASAPPTSGAPLLSPPSMGSELNKPLPTPVTSGLPGQQPLPPPPGVEASKPSPLPAATSGLPPLPPPPGSPTSSSVDPVIMSLPPPQVPAIARPGQGPSPTMPTPSITQESAPVNPALSNVLTPLPIFPERAPVPASSQADNVAPPASTPITPPLPQ